MKKYMINVNGKSYEVEVEEVKGGAGQSASPAACLLYTSRCV